MPELSWAKPFRALNAKMLDTGPLAPAFRAFAQSDAYAAAAQAMGARARRIDLDCGEALVLERAGRRLVTRGPVFAADTGPDERRRALRRLARFAGVTVATPEEPMQGFGLIPLVTGAFVAVWDLSGDLRAGMAGKWRNRLVAAEKAGLRVVRAGPKVVAPLLAAEAAQQAARRYRAHPAAFTQALPAASLRLFDWRHGGAMGAGMAFVVDGSSATYHLGWAGKAARAQGVHGLMLYQAALALRDEGVRWLDLGMVNSEEAPGLARFKLGTGATLRRLGATCLVLPG